MDCRVIPQKGVHESINCMDKGYCLDETGGTVIELQ